MARETHKAQGMTPIKVLLSDARATGQDVAAIDALLQAGYDLERARRACQPLADIVDAALSRLPLTSQEGCEQAAIDAAIERRLDRATRPYAFRLLRAEVIRTEFERLCASEDDEGCGFDDACLECKALRDDPMVGWAADNCLAFRGLGHAERIVTIVRIELRDSDEPRAYEVRDDNSSWEITSTPSTLDEDVEESVRDGDWGDDTGSWVWTGRSSCEATSEEDSHRVAFEAEEASCDHDDGHDWRSPHAMLGGLSENPGVWGGPNGGTTSREVCGHCGLYRTYQSHATNRNDGTTYAATDYEPADEASLEWVAARRNAALRKTIVDACRAVEAAPTNDHLPRLLDARCNDLSGDTCNWRIVDVGAEETADVDHEALCTALQAQLGATWQVAWARGADGYAVYTVEGQR